MRKNGRAVRNGADAHAAARRHATLRAPQNETRQRALKAPAPVVITGGAGFIGTNLTERLLREGERVVIFDNLSRRGAEQNLSWLRANHGKNLEVEVADVRHPDALRRVVRHAKQVFHFAAQVAVTTSLANPRHDFDVNALGTLNLLEALRSADSPAPLFFTSTNKVYGGLHDITLAIENDRYLPRDAALRNCGVSESRPLDLHSPYGCSKGAADEYILDYARTFGIPAVVFRMSCIYGPHQFGNEDQGWVAHFLIRALQRKPITVYGDGRQVRDLLFVDDLVQAFVLAREHYRAISGQPFNIGGGPESSVSLLELMTIIAQLDGGAPHYEFGDWRASDQRYYVSDTRKFRNATGWHPEVRPVKGVTRLYEWLCRERGLDRHRRKRALARRSKFTLQGSRFASVEAPAAAAQAE